MNKNLINITKMAECYPISALNFASRSSYSTPNHQFFGSTTIRLRYQSFVIRLNDKPRVGTPIRRNLMSTIKQP